MRVLLTGILLAVCCTAADNDEQFNGRWDITVKQPGSRGWWLEVTGAGTDAVKGKFVGAPGGQLDDIPRMSISGGEMRFVFERKYHHEAKAPERGLYWAHLQNGQLQGTFEIEGDTSTYLEWTGVRAPVLPDKDDGTWKRSDPVTLFNGHDLSGWQSAVPNKLSAWSVHDGAMQNSPSASDILSDKKFFNFDLHVEYMIQAGSNSGVGLRARYEVQILDDFGKPPSKHGNGAIYGRITPTANASRSPGEWQTFDIRIIGRQVSVTSNGVKIIDKQIIEGLTAIAYDPNEGDPGAFVLQGDHGPVMFRKIVVYPLVKAH